jgi:hypothetical protein
MSGPWRVVYADVDHTILDSCLFDPAGSVRRARPDAFDRGLPGLLDALAPKFGAEGVVLLAPAAAARCGLSTRDHTADEELVRVECERAGWSCNKVSDWSTFYAEGRPKLHVANLAMVSRDPKEFPFWGESVLDTVATLRLWHDLTGSAYRLTPGASGLAILSTLDKARAARKNAKPPATLRAKAYADPDDGLEEPYWMWRGPKPEQLQPWAFGFDAIRSYIAAAMVTEVSPWPLKPTGRIPFDRRRAGWWLCELPAWNEPRVPDPAGYNLDERGQQRMVRPLTTPTVTLLEELTAEGVYGGVRILDSCTGPARDFPLRPWAERMRDAYQLIDPTSGKDRRPYPKVFDDADVDRVRAALKVCGHKTLGALASPDSWAYMPHAWYSVVATARANQWRRMWRAGKTENRWPLWIEVDLVVYGADEDDPMAAAPRAFRCRNNREHPEACSCGIDPTGVQLGCTKVKLRRRVKTRERTAA